MLQSSVHASVGVSSVWVVELALEEGLELGVQGCHFHYFLFQLSQALVHQL